MTRVKNNNENIMRYNYEDNIYYSFNDKVMTLIKTITIIIITINMFM